MIKAVPRSRMDRERIMRHSSQLAIRKQSVNSFNGKEQKQQNKDNSHPNIYSYANSNVNSNVNIHANMKSHINNLRKTTFWMKKTVGSNGLDNCTNNTYNNTNFNLRKQSNNSKYSKQQSQQVNHALHVKINTHNSQVCSLSEQYNNFVHDDAIQRRQVHRKIGLIERSQKQLISQVNMVIKQNLPKLGSCQHLFNCFNRNLKLVKNNCSNYFRSQKPKAPSCNTEPDIWQQVSRIIDQHIQSTTSLFHKVLQHSNDYINNIKCNNLISKVIELQKQNNRLTSKYAQLQANISQQADKYRSAKQGEQAVARNVRRRPENYNNDMDAIFSISAIDYQRVINQNLKFGAVKNIANTKINQICKQIIRPIFQLSNSVPMNKYELMNTLTKGFTSSSQAEHIVRLYIFQQKHRSKTMARNPMITQYQSSVEQSTSSCANLYKNTIFNFIRQTSTNVNYNNDYLSEKVISMVKGKIIKLLYKAELRCVDLNQSRVYLKDFMHVVSRFSMLKDKIKQKDILIHWLKMCQIVARPPKSSGLTQNKAQFSRKSRNSKVQDCRSSQILTQTQIQLIQKFIQQNCNHLYQVSPQFNCIKTTIDEQPEFNNEANGQTQGITQYLLRGDESNREKHNKSGDADHGVRVQQSSQKGQRIQRLSSNKLITYKYRQRAPKINKQKSNESHNNTHYSIKTKPNESNLGQVERKSRRKVISSAQTYEQKQRTQRAESIQRVCNMENLLQKKIGYAECSGKSNKFSSQNNINMINNCINSGVFTTCSYSNSNSNCNTQAKSEQQQQCNNLNSRNRCASECTNISNVNHVKNNNSQHVSAGIAKQFAQQCSYLQLYLQDIVIVLYNFVIEQLTYIHNASLSLSRLTTSAPTACFGVQELISKGRNRDYRSAHTHTQEAIQKENNNTPNFDENSTCAYQNKQPLPQLANPSHSQAQYIAQKLIDKQIYDGIFTEQTHLGRASIFELCDRLLNLYGYRADLSEDSLTRIQSKQKAVQEYIRHVQLAIIELLVGRENGFGVNPIVSKKFADRRSTAVSRKQLSSSSNCTNSDSHKNSNKNVQNSMVINGKISNSNNTKNAADNKKRLILKEIINQTDLK